jgi:hypothetical protein
VSQQAGAVVITFADDRVERWTAVDKRMVHVSVAEVEKLSGRG